MIREFAIAADEGNLQSRGAARAADARDHAQGTPGVHRLLPALHRV